MVSSSYFQGMFLVHGLLHEDLKKVVDACIPDMAKYSFYDLKSSGTKLLCEIGKIVSVTPPLELRFEQFVHNLCVHVQ